MRQHARMRTILGQEVAGIAAALHNDSLHIWRLAYRRERQRMPLRALLALYLRVPADAVEMIEGAHGRPELVDPWRGSLGFNWSHSGETALIAVTRGGAPGIDVERLVFRPRTMALAKRFFHPEETAALASLPEPQRQRAFFELWTAKEAVLKAMGRGIAFGLHRLKFAVSPAPTRLLWLEGDDAAQWQVQSLPIDAGHVAAVAWRGPSKRVECRTLATEI